MAVSSTHDSTAQRSPLADVERALRAVPDPEIPVISVDDLGIVRAIEQVDDGELAVTITPTYSGCPAMDLITSQLQAVAAKHGWQAEVTMQLSPPWTTDWMSESGKEALREFGIAPPGVRDSGPVGLSLSVRQVTCPLCGSDQTEEVARFGSTACKALRRCLTCREPFDEFKPL